MTSTPLVSDLARAMRPLWCRCGSADIYKKGMCSRCYASERHDLEYFDGLREVVLDRDGRMCRVCFRREDGPRSLAVHHRKPGISRCRDMITLCLAHHAIVTRTHFMRFAPDLLRQLWREQHPKNPEQMELPFDERNENRILVMATKKPIGSIKQNAQFIRG